jgi:hypothetical protein
MIRDYLEEHLAQRSILLTSDEWTSVAGRGYMVVSSNLIDDDWNMKSFIVGFVHVPYPHTAERLGQHLIAAICKMSPALLNHVWSLSMDNASVNGAMVRYLNEGTIKLQHQAHNNEVIENHIEGVGNALPPPAAAATRPVTQMHCFAHI